MKSIFLILILLLSGCVLYRHDITKEQNKVVRDSVTVVTILKDFKVKINDDGIEYDSDSKNINVVTPAIGVGTK